MSDVLDSPPDDEEVEGDDAKTLPEDEPADPEEE